MEIGDYVETLKTCAENHEWDSISDLTHRLKGEFAIAMDDSGLEAFYTKTIESALDEQWLKRVTIDDITPFENELEKALALAATKTTDETKAVYLEYFFDGGDACNANIFLCVKYSEDDDGWGAEWNESGLIDGPSVNEYMDFDPDFEMQPFEEAVANAYADAILLAAAIRAWKAANISGLPFAFANHESSMIRIGSK